MAERLKNLSDKDNGFKNVKSGTAKVLISLGRLVTGCGDDGNVSTSSSANQSKIAVCSLFRLCSDYNTCNFC